MSLTGWLPKNSFLMRKRQVPSAHAPAPVTTHVTQAENALSTDSPKLSTQGNPFSKILFASAQPLEGEAAQTFQKMIQAMHLSESQILFCNIATNVALPAVHLEIQTLFQKISPVVVVCMGKLAHSIFTSGAGASSVKMVFIPHPIEFSANPALKKQAWEELKSVMKIIGSTKK